MLPDARRKEEPQVMLQMTGTRAGWGEGPRGIITMYMKTFLDGQITDFQYFVLLHFSFSKSSFLSAEVKLFRKFFWGPYTSGQHRGASEEGWP